MAPRIRRGLKASSKASAEALAEAIATPAAESSSNAEQTKENVRTAPLDEDALTIRDLFELRQSALDLLLNEPTADQVEEARGLLRGILHGCDAIIKLFADKAGEDLTQSDLDRFYEFDPCRAHGVDAGSELKNAVGLNSYFAISHVAFLQAFALQELSKMIAPPPSATDVVREGSSKKRKIDLSEPTEPIEWLEEALEKYEKSTYVWLGGGGGGASDIPAEWNEQDYWRAIINAEQARAHADLAGAHFVAGNPGTGEEQLHECEGSIYGAYYALEELVNRRKKGENPYDHEETDYLDIAGEPLLVICRAMSTMLAVIEKNVTSIEMEHAQELYHNCLDMLEHEHMCALPPIKEADRSNDGEEDEKITPPSSSEKTELDLAKSLVKGDCSLALFGQLEEEVEDEYRPEDENIEVSDDDEVKPLPDTEMVQRAKASGEEAIEALKETIELIDSVAGENKEARKKQQYRKLEEAYLLYSALINPDEAEKTKEVEEAIERVRKDGNLESTTA